MELYLIIVIVAVLFLAYSNGANDNFKGVATLYGSQTTTFKFALGWTTIFTFAGAFLSVFFAQTLIKNFSGKGLVPDDVVNSIPFVISVALAAGLTVFLATKIGMPISTTHALIGGLVGSGLVAVGTKVNFSMLGGTFLLPLILSPVLSAILSFILYNVFVLVRKSSGVSKETCVCAGNVQPALVNMDSNSGTTKVIVADEQLCKEIYQGSFVGVSVHKTVNFLHYISAAAVCFTRGLNDAPKIAGLLLIVQLSDIRYGLLGIALIMIIGGLLNSKKVAQTMSKKITILNPGQGFSANLVTSLLVGTASFTGLPVSTTHVSVGSLYGIGLKTGKNNNKVIFEILLSWILTLPIAMALSALFYFVIINLIQ